MQFVSTILNQITQSCSRQEASLCKFYEIKVRYVIMIFSEVHKYWIADWFLQIGFILLFTELFWIHILTFMLKYILVSLMTEISYYLFGNSALFK